MSDEPPRPEKELLEKLKSTSGADLAKGVRTAEKLSPEEEDGHGRWLKSQKKRIQNKLHSWFMHFLFVVICGVVLVIVIGTIILTWTWIQTFMSEPEKLEKFLVNIWNFALVALATLFVNSLMPRD